MHSTSLTSRSTAAAGALVAAAGLAASGVIQLIDEQSSVTTTEGAIEHLNLALFTLVLLAQVPAVLHLGRRTGRVPSLLASAGLVALGLLTTVSNVRGEDPSFFAAVAVPSNLLWLGGLVALGVLLFRRRAVPRPAAVALPFTWACSIPLAVVGGGLLGSVLWLVIVRLALTAERTPARAERLQVA